MLLRRLLLLSESQRERERERVSVLCLSRILFCAYHLNLLYLIATNATVEVPSAKARALDFYRINMPLGCSLILYSDIYITIVTHS